MDAVAAMARVFTAADLTEAQLQPLAGGLCAAYTTRCPGKSSPNEDACAVLEIDARRGVLAVADGLGGQPGGADASRIAVNALETALADAPPESLSRPVILDAVETANREILELGIGAATTFAAVEIEDGGLRPYHVGDSAVLVVGQRGKIKLQTISHSPVGYALESGMLGEREAMRHDDRHLVSNMVGASDMRIEVGSRLELRPRDTVLVASDGVLDNLTGTEIADLVRTGSLSDAARRLSEECSRRMRSSSASVPSKPDDMTFLLYRRGTASRPD